jgi:RimJ/RimL family protein N-acetyltransferase
MKRHALPNLSTPRLDLRQWREADVPALIEMESDREVMRFVGGTRPCEPARLRRAFLERIGKDFGPGLGYWSVLPKGEPAHFMGWVCLVPLPGYRDIEIGYRFKRAFWGQGYASEACQACLDYAFGELGLEEVVAVAHPENTRSHRILAKLGFSASGVRHAYGEMLPFYRRRSDRGGPLGGGN